jgi:hypothetical protein
MRRKRKVREASKPSRTAERSMSESDEVAHELTSHLQEIANELGLTLRSQTDYANLLRKVVRAGARIAFWTRRLSRVWRRISSRSPITLRNRKTFRSTM